MASSFFIKASISKSEARILRPSTAIRFPENGAGSFLDNHS